MAYRTQDLSQLVDVPLAERYPILVDLSRVAMGGGVVWTILLALLISADRAPLWTLVTIPAGIIALVVYLRVIGASPKEFPATDDGAG